ncbi:MAG: hypothetical protein K0S56_866 [Microvirga sp.]|jgi:hypothetical protein|nr:hypothetical protein [Microvirga sp.]
MRDEDIVRRLFAVMTAMLEDSHELAVTGQSQIAARDECHKASGDVSRLAHEVAAIATTVQVLMREENR